VDQHLSQIDRRHDERLTPDRGDEGALSHSIDRFAEMLTDLADQSRRRVSHVDYSVALRVDQSSVITSEGDTLGDSGIDSRQRRQRLSLSGREDEICDR
jgi:hypothetical protein